MKKTNSNKNFIPVLLFILILLLASCSSKTSVPSDSVDAQLQNVKNTAAQITESPEVQQAKNVSVVITQEAGQTIILPQQPAQGQIPQNALSPNYVAPCLLKNYRILNKYCSFKNFWHLQGTLISWYISFPVLLLAFVIAIIVIWWFYRQIKK